MNRTPVTLIVIITCASAWGNIAYAVEAKPSRSDIKVFVDHTETCLHLAGEFEGENTPEQKRLIDEANRYCDRAKREYRVLKVKYKKDKKVQRILERYRADLLE